MLKSVLIMAVVLVLLILLIVFGHQEKQESRQEAAVMAICQMLKPELFKNPNSCREIE